MIARVDSESGEIDELRRSEMETGTPIYTGDFAVTRWPATNGLYVFGGRDGNGVRPSRLWYGRPAVNGQGETVYRWQELMGSHPAGRTSAILVADPAANRILLIGGQTDAGTSSEGFAFDVSTHAWSSLDLSRSGIGARESAAYSSDGQRLCVYGGLNNGSPTLRGLLEVELGSLTGRVVDSGTPGIRHGSSIRYDPRSRTVTLFGGSVGTWSRRGWSWQIQNDVQRFTFSNSTTWPEGAWQVLSSGRDLVPPPMRGAPVLVSRRDGAVTVVPSNLERGATSQLWRLRGNAWSTSDQLMVWE